MTWRGSQHRVPGRPSAPRYPFPMTDSPRTAWGYGLATETYGGALLDAWFPEPQLGDAPAADPYAEPASLAALARDFPAREVRTRVVQVAIDLDAPPADVPDAYLRLHLL